MATNFFFVLHWRGSGGRILLYRVLCICSMCQWFLLCCSWLLTSYTFFCQWRGKQKAIEYYKGWTECWYWRLSGRGKRATSSCRHCCFCCCRLQREYFNDKGRRALHATYHYCPFPPNNECTWISYIESATKQKKTSILTAQPEEYFLSTVVIFMVPRVFKKSVRSVLRYSIMGLPMKLIPLVAMSFNFSWCLKGCTYCLMYWWT